MIKYTNCNNLYQIHLHAEPNNPLSVGEIERLGRQRYVLRMPKFAPEYFQTLAEAKMMVDDRVRRIVRLYLWDGQADAWRSGSESDQNKK